MDGFYNLTGISYQQFFNKVIRYLIYGLLLTVVMAGVISYSGVTKIIAPYYYAILITSSILEIIFVLYLSFQIDKISISRAQFCYVAYSLLNGITISLLLQMVAPGATLLAFGLTCGYFGLLSAIVKNSKADFIKYGQICMAVLPVLIIGYILLLFIDAPMIYYIIVFLDLVLFSGITMHDLKRMEVVYQNIEENQLESAAMLSAIELYIDFINIFIDIIILIFDNN